MSEQNIRIRLTGESDIDKLNQDLQNLEDQERDIRAEMLKTQAEYQKQVAAIQANVKGREAQIAAIDKLQKKHTEYQRTLESEQKKVKTSMEQYNAALRNVNDTVAQGAVSTPRLTAQLRALKDELARMEASGVSPTDAAFTNLAVEAARLEDQMGDTQQRVRVLASDTKNLDAAMSVGQGLAGGFTVATSAAALLGGESEELQKAFFKVQAAMSILNGVNQVAIALNKDSAARVVISTAITNNETIAKVKNYAATKIQAANTAIEAAVTGKGVIAKGAATAAQWALNAAMYAFPLVAIIAALAAVVVGIVKFTQANKAAKELQDDFNSSLESTKRLMENITNDTEFSAKLAAAEGKSQEAILNIRKDSAKRQLDIADANYDNLLTKYNTASKKERKALKDGLDEADNMRRDAFKNLNSILEEQTLLTISNNTKQTDDFKKKSEDRIAQAKKEAEERKKLEIETQNAVDSARNALERKSTTDIEKIYQERIDIINRFNDEALKSGQVTEAELSMSRKEILESDNEYLKDWLRRRDEALTVFRQKNITDNKASNNIQSKDEEVYVENWLTTLSRRKELGLIKESDYLDQKLDYLIKSNASEEQLSQARFEIEKYRMEQEEELFRKKEERKQAILQQSVALLSQIGNAYFDSEKEKYDEELELLERNYTTDAKRAAENSNLKLISEQEFQRKQLEIKQKQAKADKAQALFNIAIDTIVAAISSLKTDPTGILAILIGLSGGAAAVKVASKPLPRYAKGKSAGGAGHFATVGEQGAETMWIPDGAAVIPHGKPMDWRTFEQFNIPNIAGLGDKYIRGAEIDYNKLGRAVADNIKIPTPKPVTVNVDKNGISTFDGISTTKYLNKKYTGEW